MELIDIAKQAKQAASQIAKASTEQKNEILKALADELKKQASLIYEENEKDLAEGLKKGLDEAMLDRLSLKNRLDNIIQDIFAVIQLEDPVGSLIETKHTDELLIKKIRTPLGVLGVIYESRPNVTIDVSALSIKSGNAAILKGGIESFYTNRRLVDLIQKVLISQNLPPHTIQLLPKSDRSMVQQLLKMDDYIDLIIPRGGAGLHQFCKEHSSIPVITGGIGICHLYVDESADLEKSIKVIDNAKTQRPTVCNALDTLLVNQKIARKFIPALMHQLSFKKVNFRLDPQSFKIAQDLSEPLYQLAQESDWKTEWLGLTLGIKVVENIEQALQHIQKYSSGHSDGILSENSSHIERFLKEIDSAAVYANASTRFTDGGQLGLGAEVAISTQKFHARGPMGLEELCSYKWTIEGHYTIRK